SREAEEYLFGGAERIDEAVKGRDGSVDLENPRCQSLRWVNYTPPCDCRCDLPMPMPPPASRS
ncbi:hypothetical protein PanWU01x14_053190, partial [Parasponia andersonii]